MTTVTIAFDIDGTLRCNCTDTCRDTNEQVVQQAELFSRMKNTKLIAWSGGGAPYAQSFVDSDPRLQAVFGERCYGKLSAPHVDIAVDDQHEFNLGDLNLIVRAK